MIIVSPVIKLQKIAIFFVACFNPLKPYEREVRGDPLVVR